MKKKKIRIAVLGCGRQAWLACFPWIKESPDMELAAIADRDPEMLRKTAAAFKPRAVFSDGMEMIAKCDADALIVVTPPWAHADPVVAAAARGMHVLCEKPMAATVEDCVRMARACDKAGVILQIGFSLRFDPGYEVLKTVLKKNEIGKVFQLHATYDAWIPDITKSPFKEIKDAVEQLQIFPPGMGAWRMSDPRTNGGVYSDHGIHYIDMFRWFMEEEITAATGAVMKVSPDRVYEDHASSFLRFENGAAASIEASLVRMDTVSLRQHGLDEGILYGDSGSVRYLMDQSWYIRGFPHLDRTHAKVWKYGVPSMFLGKWLPVSVPHGRKYTMFKRQLDWFVSRINGAFIPHPVFGDTWGASARDGLMSVRIVHAVYESSRTNTTVVPGDPLQDPAPPKLTKQRKKTVARKKKN